MGSEKMRPYEFMVYPTLQTAWIEGKGILLFAGLFLVEFGAGLFVAASIFNALWAQTAGWLISGVIGGGCHFLFLGHPFRIYRAIVRPGKAWISRGLIVISLFQFSGFIHLALSYFSMPVPWVMIVANLLAVATILYGGFEIADVKTIPTWHSGFLPIQMLARSFFIGLAIVLIVNLLMGRPTPRIDSEQWLLMILFINVCLFVFALISLGLEEGKQKLSLSMMTRGDLKWIFWPWIVGGGMIAPLIVALYALAGGEPETIVVMLLAAVLLQVMGDSLLRYVLIRSGYFPGIFPRVPADFRK
jgi:formate-dependent nitrite reductase membrane component NrfD